MEKQLDNCKWLCSMVCQMGKIITTTLVYFLLFSVCLVLLYRFIPVPFTPLMIARTLEARLDGEELQIHHQWVPYHQISTELVRAVIDAEDAHFYEHKGFDIEAIQYAIEMNERYGRIICGGSTISQQTAKNVFCINSRTYLRKAFEAYYTVLIELLWGKERILEVYLNMVEMGDGVFGAEAAAQAFFHCSAEQLSASEAKQIAYSLSAPRIYMGKPEYY